MVGARRQTSLVLVFGGEATFQYHNAGGTAFLSYFTLRVRRGRCVPATHIYTNSFVCRGGPRRHRTRVSQSSDAEGEGRGRKQMRRLGKGPSVPYCVAIGEYVRLTSGRKSESWCSAGPRLIIVLLATRETYFINPNTCSPGIFSV